MLSKPLFLVLFISACGADKEVSSHSERHLPPKGDLSSYDELELDLTTRLLGSHLEDGWVVSMTPGGEGVPIREAVHTGDSALWTGLALAALDCQNGKELLDALIKGIKEFGGMIPRFKETPVGNLLNPSSRDMVTGVMLGFVVRAQKCPDDRQAIAEAWKLHRDFVLARNGALFENAGVDYQVVAAMRWIWDEVARVLGVIEKNDSSRVLFEGGLVATTATITQLKEACYPVHLGTLQSLTAYALGSPVSAATRVAFCATTAGADIPLTNWYCEQPEDFAKTFELNKWEYRHQRCGAWEKPDGFGVETPAIDFLVYKQLVTQEMFSWEKNY